MYGSILDLIMKTKLPRELKFILSRKLDKTTEVWEWNELIDGIDYGYI